MDMQLCDMGAKKGATEVVIVGSVEAAQAEGMNFCPSCYGLSHAKVQDGLRLILDEHQLSHAILEQEVAVAWGQPGPPSSAQCS